MYQLFFNQTLTFSLLIVKFLDTKLHSAIINVWNFHTDESLKNEH